MNNIYQEVIEVDMKLTVILGDRGGYEINSN